jgi:malonate transporter MadL subunit
MAIYGTALLSICLLIGLATGRYIGFLCGLNSDIGGVGIAMLLLLGCCGYLQRSGRLKPPTESGILFWGSIYVPIVVAMAACQDVSKAAQGGLIAILAGGLTVLACFFLVGLLVRLGDDPEIAVVERRKDGDVGS